MSATTVDPRIRQRRMEVARAAGRRRLRRVIMVVALLTTVVLVWLTVHSSLLGVRSVAVIGSAHTSSAEIIGAAAIGSDRPLIEVDSSEVEARVARLAWVDEVRVERRWPTTLRITVTERSAVAVALGDDGVARLVDRRGRVLDRVTDAPALVRVSGPVAAGSPGDELPPAARLALEVAARLPPSLANNVSGVSWASSGAAGLSLVNDNRQVLLGDAAHLGDALVALISMLERPDLPAGMIDLRVPSSPVIRPNATTLGEP
jgi:cell division protein FtsQ